MAQTTYNLESDTLAGRDEASTTRAQRESLRPRKGRQITETFVGGAWVQVTDPAGRGMTPGGLYSVQVSAARLNPRATPIVLYIGELPAIGTDDVAPSAQYALEMGACVFFRLDPNEPPARLWVLGADLVDVGSCIVRLIPWSRNGAV